MYVHNDFVAKFEHTLRSRHVQHLTAAPAPWPASFPSKRPDVTGPATVGIEFHRVFFCFQLRLAYLSTTWGCRDGFKMFYDGLFAAQSLAHCDSFWPYFACYHAGHTDPSLPRTMASRAWTVLGPRAMQAL